MKYKKLLQSVLILGLVVAFSPLVKFAHADEVTGTLSSGNNNGQMSSPNNPQQTSEGTIPSSSISGSSDSGATSNDSLSGRVESYSAYESSKSSTANGAGGMMASTNQTDNTAPDSQTTTSLNHLSNGVVTSSHYSVSPSDDAALSIQTETPENELAINSRDNSNLSQSSLAIQSGFGAEKNAWVWIIPLVLLIGLITYVTYRRLNSQNYM